MNNISDTDPEPGNRHVLFLHTDVSNIAECQKIRITKFRKQKIQIRTAQKRYFAPKSTEYRKIRCFSARKTVNCTPIFWNVWFRTELSYTISWFSKWIGADFWENLSADDTLFSGEQGASVPREYLRKTLEMWSVFRRQLPRYFAFTVILYISNISRSCLSRHWPIVSFSEFCASWSKFGSYFHLWATGTHENTLKSIVRSYYTTR